MRKIYCTKRKKYKEFKKPKISYVSTCLVFVTNVGVKIKKIFMKEEPIEILKIIFLLIICKIPNERKKA